MQYFEKELNHIEHWKYLRKDLFRNCEPQVTLIGITKPINGKHVISETLPGYTARMSHESQGSVPQDLELNKKLIKLGHHTPLEAVQFVYLVEGISKSLAGQWTRHRAGIGWTFRSTRYVKASTNNFVYPALEYLEDQELVKNIYQEYEKIHVEAISKYFKLCEVGVRNQEARRIMPVGWATDAYVYVNARALRHFFKLRLATSAEWEIRRLAYLLFNDAANLCPTLFEDLIDEKSRQLNLKY